MIVTVTWHGSDKLHTATFHLHKELSVKKQLAEYYGLCYPDIVSITEGNLDDHKRRTAANEQTSPSS